MYLYIILRSFMILTRQRAIKTRYNDVNVVILRDYV